MRRAIWAIYFHRLSTNSMPRHQMCNILWCKYLQSEKDPKIKFDHKSHNLPEAVMDEIKPIFKLLSKRVIRPTVSEGTQNSRARSARMRVAERTLEPSRRIVQKETLT